MKREIITITDSGTVAVPNNVKMRDFEIADLFGVYTQTIRANIRAILKSGAVQGDIGSTLTAVGGILIPEYHNLETIITLAFRIKSHKSKIFRQWLMRRVTKQDITTTLVMHLQNAILN